MIAEAILTPNYSEGPDPAIDYNKLEREFRNEYLLRNSVLLWRIDQYCHDFPECSFLRRKKEYKNTSESPSRFLARGITSGVPYRLQDVIHVINGQVSLDFTVAEEVTENKSGNPLPLHILSLRYEGWRDAWLIPFSSKCRKPDVIETPETILGFDFLERLLKEKY
ncbi:MAG: hypothetical protein AABX05_01210 [Nanoarchaeota archaeon]